ncbi:MULTISPECIES: phage terminase small subunit P27 family [Intestinimonas]|uniref:phage terminase small subunit P27 family n=1 Tax=Intestinimonas TaxID=1392389 RepID=UPI00067EEA5B|nr:MULTISPECIES: phage terminase small subunit P27 family [Intestinimonas]MBS6283636.1 phage terminase small subunit P27 family [Oscillospiraceae bacterium]MCI5562394.1 phage terminase small subunit P27 family [Intestinimonas massiliensis (ex Afouda et al. 2020)]MDY5338134.1 phage terminase small subunit P27 family [Intestinimonas sp.]
MSGTRQTLEVLEGSGKKHLTKKEKGERAAAEVRAEVPKQIRPPEYLPEALKKEFRALGGKLKEAGLLTVLDYDTLARYLLAKQSYLAATQEVLKIQRGRTEAGKRVIDMEALDGATRVQDRFFKQCRGAANDMGLTVTSRCRLVLPPGAGGKAPEENPFERMMRERMHRA